MRNGEMIITHAGSIVTFDCRIRGNKRDKNQTTGLIDAKDPRPGETSASTHHVTGGGSECGDDSVLTKGVVKNMTVRAHPTARPPVRGLHANPDPALAAGERE